MKHSRFFALLILFAFALPAVAQVDTGSIIGTVKDASGGVLPGVTVTLVGSPGTELEFAL